MIPKPFTVIYGCRGDIKSRDIALQSNHGMDLEAEISLFFGRAFSIICTIRTEGTAIPVTPEFTDWKGEAVNYKVTAGWYGE